MSSRVIKNRPKKGLIEAKRQVAACEESGAQHLRIDGLGLSELPIELLNLPWLQSLDVHNNDLHDLPAWLGELSELRELYIWDNPIQRLPSGIRRLTQLRSLLAGGGAASLADGVIGSFGELRELGLAGLGLGQVPSWIRKLQKLERLHLFENRISELPVWLDELEALRYLDVNTNILSTLPASLQFLRALEYLDVRENVALDLPDEILPPENATRILDYYFRTASINKREALNEFKLILVGRGGVGKTTLVHRLVTDGYKEFKRTPGVKITKWGVPIDGEEIRAHIWDFGGQEIMHGTHRFFMTERALYLVLVSGREGSEDRDADYWLSLVRSFGGNVPIIVLLHKCDNYPFELNRRLLREKFGNKLVFLDTDSLTGTGIKDLRDRICQLAKKLPGLKAAWPTEWRRIKDDLPSKKKSWLTFEDFRLFCSDEGIDKPHDQEALADSLHDLGLMLSYRKEESLRDFGVLNPQWVTRGIYQVLTSRVLRDAQGKFSARTLADVLPTQSYPKTVHPFLLALMRKFRLSHPLDDAGQKYLIPELLTKEEPDLESEFPPERCLCFVYRYDSVLPEGLLPRFIVETYVHREPKYAWRTGVVLERANCRAFVRGDVQGRTVTIRVAGVGQGRRELLGIIREYFERIHKGFENLPVTELVPVPKHPEVLIRYQELIKYEAFGDDEYKIMIDEIPRKLSVAMLLDGVDLPRNRRDLPRSSIIAADQTVVSRPLSLFISYSHKDELFRDELRGALIAYERQGELLAWDDTNIIPGQKWQPEILGKLEEADIIVLLLSNDFIASDYCVLKEMNRARERDAKGECAIVPVVVRACRFSMLELGQIQAICPGGKPVKQNKDRDGAWLEVTDQLDRVIADFRQRASRRI